MSGQIRNVVCIKELEYISVTLVWEMTKLFTMISEVFMSKFQKNLILFLIGWEEKLQKCW